MNKNYYQTSQKIPTVTREDIVTGSIDKWEAHAKGILHRAFTGLIVVKDCVVLQHRKHPVFDGYFDLSFSSHPLVDDEKELPEEDAVLQSLEREWVVKEKNPPISLIGSVYYKANDSGSSYVEHEIDRLYKIELEEIPSMNYSYAYGMSVCRLEAVKKEDFPLYRALAPWVIEFFDQGIL